MPALFGWPLIFLAFPVLLQHLLSAAPPEHTIFYHYGASIAPFILLAVMRSLTLCCQKFSRRIFAAIFSLLIIIAMMDMSRYLTMFRERLDFYQDDLSAVRWFFVNAIPPQEGVITTFDYLAPLSMRKDLYAFHKVYNDSYQNPDKIALSELNTGKAFILPDQVHYALLDLQDPGCRKHLI